jgi:hypothetical protein
MPGAKDAPVSSAREKAPDVNVDHHCLADVWLRIRHDRTASTKAVRRLVIRHVGKQDPGETPLQATQRKAWNGNDPIATPLLRQRVGAIHVVQPCSSRPFGICRE